MVCGRNGVTGLPAALLVEVVLRLGAETVRRFYMVELNVKEKMYRHRTVINSTVQVFPSSAL